MFCEKNKVASPPFWKENFEVETENWIFSKAVMWPDYSNQSISQCAVSLKGYGPLGYLPTNWLVDANLQSTVHPVLWNILMNRLGILNNQIEFDWLNLSLNSFKIKSKKLFLSNSTWITTFLWHNNYERLNNFSIM